MEQSRLIHATTDIKRVLGNINGMIKANERKIISSTNISLHTGSAGVLLYGVLYTEIMDDPSFDNMASEIINQMMETLSGHGSISPSFCEGLSGIGWLLLFLKEIDYLDYDPDHFLTDTDRYLNSFLDLFLQEGKWDLLYGYVGIGFYFLKRMNRQSLEKIVHVLDKTVVFHKTGMAWERFEPHFSKDIIDLGLAHGNAGIVVFLSQCYKQGILKDTCQKLLGGVLDFYIDQQQEFDIIGSFWKDFTPIDPNAREIDGPKFSKLAWCYGDLTILNALHQAAETISDREKSGLLKALAIETSKRRGYDESLIKDAFFCHGSSGIMLIYQELFERTGETAFKESADYWLNITLSAFLEQEEQIMALKDPLSESKFELLDGASGIGCALLNRIPAEVFGKLKVQSWKEAFFLFKSSSIN